jgi:predicted RNA binding protein YcfA (HicA-like mRNA interferase family)
LGDFVKKRCKKTTFSTKVLEELKKAGWEILRIGGRHDIYAQPGNSSRLTVPNKIDNRGLAHKVLKDAGCLPGHRL